MDFKKLGKGLQDSLHSATDTVKTKAKDVDWAEIKSEVRQAGENATSKVKGLVKKDDGKAAAASEDTEAITEAPSEVAGVTVEQEVQEAQKATAQAVQEAQEAAAQAVREAPEAADLKVQKVPETVSEQAEIEAAPQERKVKHVCVDAALKVIYLLMSADGKILHGEEEKFEEIGKELDPDFETSKAQIIQECQAALDKMIDPEDYFDALCYGADKALETPPAPEKPMISARHLVWNLLSVAYSDESYDDAERRLIKHIVRKLDVDKAVFLEMESSILTLMDIERELTWIKTTDRPYLTIEFMVNELMNRKKVIFESVLDLISL